jgi:hypothetical protein
MSRNVLLVLFGAGLAGITFTTPGRTEDGMEIPRETRGMIIGTMAHLKEVKLKEAPAVAPYIVNTNNVERADPETVKFIWGILYTSQLDFLPR